MSEPNMRLGVGVFVLASIVLLAVLATLFTRFTTLWVSHNHYSVIFKEATGVAPGTPVRRSGIRIGEVTSVQLDDETSEVDVGFVVEKDHTLRRSDEPVLAHGLLGGDTSIDFVPRRDDGKAPDRSAVAPGTVFTGTSGPDVLSLVGQTADLVPTTREALNDMRKSLQRIDRLTPLMEETAREYRDLARSTREVLPQLRKTNDEILVTARNWGKLGERLDVLVQSNQDKLVKTLENLNDTIVRVGKVFSDDNQRNLTTTLKNVRAGSESLESITKNTDAMIKESRQTIQRVNSSVTRADDVLTNLQQATKPMAERSGRVMKNLDESTENLNKTLAETRVLLRDFSQGDGTLRRFLNDPALYNNINDAACMLTRMLPRVDRILRDAEVFADKIARHPESLGVGGAISPSSGLKESPTNSHWYRGPGH